MSTENTINEAANPACFLGAINDSFICKGCRHKLDMIFQVRTKDYCYLCDPNITLDECLSDKPLNVSKLPTTTH